MIEYFYRLSYSWAFEGVNDTYDTYLGKLANGTSVAGFTSSKTLSLAVGLSVTQTQDA